MVDASIVHVGDGAECAIVTGDSGGQVILHRASSRGAVPLQRDCTVLHTLESAVVQVSINGCLDARCCAGVAKELLVCVVLWCGVLARRLRVGA